MVVPVGLRREGSDNNDHGGLFPGSLGSVLHHLEYSQAATTTEKMASRSQQQLPFSKNHPAADHFLRHQHLPLSSWSFSPSLLDKSRELEQHQHQQVSSSTSMTATGWSPKGCFFQLQPQQQQQQNSSMLLFSPSPPQQQEQQQAFSLHPKSTDHARRGGGSSKKARSSTVETPAAEPPRAASKEPPLSSSCRRDDSSSSLSSSIHRGGKMTSLGASPKCNVCSHKPNEARVITFCGHLLCWPCLCCWLHNKSPDKECPVCNRPLTKNHITPLHGRQNSLTVARLQGMLRPEKTTSTPRVHSRGGDGAWSRRHQSRISTATTAAASAASATSKSAPAGPRSIVFDATPKVNTSKVEDDSSSSIMRILTGHSSSKFFTPALTPPPATVAAAAAATEVNNWSRPAEKSCFDRDPPAVPALSSTEAMELASSSSPTVVEEPSSSPTVVEEQYQHGNTGSLCGAISTVSTVVTTDACRDDARLAPIKVSSPPAAYEGSFAEVAGYEEIRELGVLLSLEWEGAMSAIENAWRDAVSDVLNAGGNTADAMGVVERLSREKETIIHELASEPLKGSNWLASRLEYFTMIASEEIDKRTPVPQEFIPMEIEDWFLDSPDDGQTLFPEFVEQEQAEVADGEYQRK
ncbi:hypothetical protein SELMODRAFT_416062 [Selaginella moellendorffii]|uniref:RanBP-type and C3HC4-type zinc finger-containing protein 1 n=1 Tax=Selaginella moellendorffii TaxID=88036 RepID=D8RXY6_SELML|nr:hypothetical protein SELMODRAFT_416062 [Selaginella moellendorffii]